MAGAVGAVIGLAIGGGMLTGVAAGGGGACAATPGVYPGGWYGSPPAGAVEITAVAAGCEFGGGGTRGAWLTYGAPTRPCASRLFQYPASPIQAGSPDPLPHPSASAS